MSVVYVLMGEGPELFLTCFVEEYGQERLHIMWEEYDRYGHNKMRQFIMPYESFCDEVNKWFENNEKYYHDNFGYEYD